MSQPIQGILNLSDTTDSGNPSSGTLDFYAQSVAGFMMPKIGGPNNVDVSLQNSCAFNRIIIIGPGSGSITSINTSITAGSGIGTSTPSSTNLSTSVRSISLTTTTTTGNIASFRTGALECWRGNSAGLGGFLYVARHNLVTLVSGMRVFIGLEDVTTVPSNVDPTTSATIGKLGMAINANSGNWNFVNNAAGTAPTVTGLGTNIPVNTTDHLEFVMYCPPNGSTITYRITNLSTGNVVNGSVSTNIPAATTFLALHAWITNNATAASTAFNVARIYLESDY